MKKRESRHVITHNQHSSNDALVVVSGVQEFFVTLLGAEPVEQALEEVVIAGVLTVVVAAQDEKEDHSHLAGVSTGHSRRRSL